MTKGHTYGVCTNGLGPTHLVIVANLDFCAQIELVAYSTNDFNFAITATSVPVGPPPLASANLEGKRFSEVCTDPPIVPELGWVYPVAAPDAWVVVIVFIATRFHIVTKGDKALSQTEETVFCMETLKIPWIIQAVVLNA